MHTALYCSHPFRSSISGGVILAAMLLAGCESMDPHSPAPAGPGAATETDLTPWLSTATNDTRTGELQFVNVASPLGSYYTWSLAPDDPTQAVEVDIRACSTDAHRLIGQMVTISGKLICRGDRHLPLLVAQQIEPTSPVDTVT